MRILLGYTTCQHTVAAFQAQGHEVWTCDIRPSDYVRHIQDDIVNVAMRPGWGFGLFHPMCTYLTVSAAWAFGDGPYHQNVKAGTLVGEARRAARERALENFRWLLSLPYPKAIENPAPSFVSKAIRPPDQTIQPYQFGDDASKRTGLWLDRVPKLRPTRFVQGRTVNGRQRWSNQTDGGQNRVPPSETRWLERSATYPGVAAAIGEQWGAWLS